MKKAGRGYDRISRALSKNLVLKSPATSIDNFGTGEQTCCSSNSAIDSIRANPDNEACCSISTANGSIGISPIDQACCSTTTINDNIGHDKNLKEICNNSSSSSSPSGTEFDSDDSVKDKDYVPPQKKKAGYPQLFDSDSENDVIQSSQPLNNVCISETSSEDVSEPESNIQENQNVEVQLTKKGTIRKRKYYATKLAVRQEIMKKLKNESKYYVKTGCDENCKKKCSTKFSESQRISLNKLFRNMTWKEQTYFKVTHLRRIQIDVQLTVQTRDV
ncbi:unnamed protein product [Parnassius apollo]|uniref:(apollo) hypothetical protein n=1 Tax=Parnassius apollo TaxID=110799 RepID=A0A8S3XDP6_PARAO|nr:unnamed protein product [Parnassius apollo]